MSVCFAREFALCFPFLKAVFFDAYFFNFFFMLYLVFNKVERKFGWIFSSLYLYYSTHTVRWTFIPYLFSFMVSIEMMGVILIGLPKCVPCLFSLAVPTVFSLFCMLLWLIFVVWWGYLFILVYLYFFPYYITTVIFFFRLAKCPSTHFSLLYFLCFLFPIFLVSVFCWLPRFPVCYQLRICYVLFFFV